MEITKNDQVIFQRDVKELPLTLILYHDGVINFHNQALLPAKAHLSKWMFPTSNFCQSCGFQYITKQLYFLNFKSLKIFDKNKFLDVSTHLYKRLCPSVYSSVCSSYYFNLNLSLTSSTIRLYFTILPYQTFFCNLFSTIFVTILLTQSFTIFFSISAKRCIVVRLLSFLQINFC